MEKKFLSISEFATARGVSKQAVYQQLNKRLKPFVQEIDGKKVLDIEALSAFEVQEVEQVSSQVEQEVEQEVEPKETDFLREQIEKKDTIIAELLEQIKALQKQNETLTNLLQGSQILLAQEQKKLLLEDKKRGWFSRLFHRD